MEYVSCSRSERIRVTHFVLPCIIFLLRRVSNHPNVAYFCGVTLKPYFCIVGEFYDHGNVVDYLRKSKQTTWNQIVNMAISAAAGKQTDGGFSFSKPMLTLYNFSGVLHLHKERIIHRDLAARNLLLDSNLNGINFTWLMGGTQVHDAEFFAITSCSSCGRFRPSAHHENSILW